MFNQNQIESLFRRHASSHFNINMMNVFVQLFLLTFEFNGYFTTARIIVQININERDGFLMRFDNN